MTRARIRIRRAYEPPGRGDGQRVLVDRLWPRGAAKSALPLDAWARDVAPSSHDHALARGVRRAASGPRSRGAESMLDAEHGPRRFVPRGETCPVRGPERQQPAPVGTRSDLMSIPVY